MLSVCGSSLLWRFILVKVSQSLTTRRGRILLKTLVILGELPEVLQRFQPSPYGVRVPYPSSALMRSPTRNLEFLFWPFFNGIFVWFGYPVVTSQN